MALRPASVRPTKVLTRRLVALCACAFLGYWSLNGVGFLVVLFSSARFGLDSARSGLLLSAFGLANMLCAAPAGAAVDRYGSVRVSGTGAAGATVVLALLPLAPHPLVLGVLLLAGGGAVAALWAGLSKAAVQVAPARRATASSLFNAWKFVGYAVAPLAYAPLYASAGPRVAFGVAAGASLLLLANVRGKRHWRRSWRRQAHHSRSRSSSPACARAAKGAHRDRERSSPAQRAWSGPPPGWSPRFATCLTLAPPSRPTTDEVPLGQVHARSAAAPSSAILLRPAGA